MPSSLPSSSTGFLALLRVLSGCIVLGWCVEESNGFGRIFISPLSKHCLTVHRPAHLQAPIGASKNSHHCHYEKQRNKGHCHPGCCWNESDDGDNKIQRHSDKHDVDDETHLKTTTTKMASYQRLRRRVVAMLFIFAVCNSLLLVPPSFGREDYKCPKYFASQTLGIQNVVHLSTTNGEQDNKQKGRRQQESLWPSPVSLTSPQRRHAASQHFCPQEDSTSQTIKNDYMEESIIRGIVYLPSPSSFKSGTPSSASSVAPPPAVIEKSDNLIITISSANTHDGKLKQQPSLVPSDVVLAGAKIPLSQIQSFPITFAIGSSNVLLSSSIGNSNNEEFSSSTTSTANDNMQRQQQQMYESIIRNDSLQVTAKICPSAPINNDSCTESNAKLFGKGISIRLILPFELFKDDTYENDANNVEKGNKKQNEEGEQETAMIVRAAVPIRLVQSSSPDRLFTW